MPSRNAIIALSALFLFFDLTRQRGDAFLLYSGPSAMLLSVAILIAALPYFDYYARRITFQALLASILSTLAILLAIFAQLNAEAGLLCGGAHCPDAAPLMISGAVAEAPHSTSLRDALYFAMVTFTTLGYGDFQPHPDLRLMAGCLAFGGYLHLALLIGAVQHCFESD